MTMFDVIKVFLFLQLHTVVVFCNTKPEKPCEVNDHECVTKLSADLFTSALNADPSAGFEVIDPMHHDVVEASLPTINFTLKDCTVVGLKELQIQSAKISDHHSVYITIIFPHYEMSGMYEVNGKFIDSPLMGNGNFTVKETNIKVDVEIMKHYYKKNDKLHFKIKSFEFTTELMGKLHLDADNLYNGNKELSDSILKLINANDKVVASVWNPPITTANLNKIFNNINMILEDVSLDDIVYNKKQKLEL